MIAYVRNWDGRSMSVYLTLDATSWKFGAVNIQLLVLSLVYRNVSLPLYWVNLAKKGHRSGAPLLPTAAQARFAAGDLVVSLKRNVPAGGSGVCGQRLV